MSFQIVSGNLSLQNTRFCIDKTNHSGNSQSRIQENKNDTRPQWRQKNQDHYKFGRVCFIASVGHIKWMHENHNHLGCMSSWYKIQPLTYTLLIVFNKLQGRQVQSCSKSMSSNLPTKKNTKYFNVSHIYNIT